MDERERLLSKLEGYLTIRDRVSDGLAVVVIEEFVLRSIRSSPTPSKWPKLASSETGTTTAETATGELATSLITGEIQMYGRKAG